MMAGPTNARNAPMTPQLALRVAIIGGCALVVFALIFFRLWFLQVLDGSHYVALAKQNSTQVIPVAAPRGLIIGRSNNVLVSTQAVPAILIAPESLPVKVSLDTADPGALAHQPARDLALYTRLAKVLGMSKRPSACKYQFYPGHNKVETFAPKLAPISCLVARGVAAAQYANVTVKTNVPPDVRNYLAERRGDFPGVLSEKVYLRKYPLGDVGAQVFGTLGALTEQEYQGRNLNGSHFKGSAPGSVVGQSGLEHEYNQYLQGVAGEERVKVNSGNQFEGYAKGEAPQEGDTLKLSLDSRLEKVGQHALDTAIKNHPGANGGAFVALDPDQGAVYAMGSAPTFDPSFFTHPFTQAAYKAEFDNDTNPLINRATQGAGPDGSTFKLITATAALQSGTWSPDQTYDATDCFKADATASCQHNAGDEAPGVIDISTALEESIDTFFYNLGKLMNFDPDTHPDGGALQKWARLYGLGQPTGIDLPGGVTGSIPSPRYLKYLYRQEVDCEKAVGPYAGHPRHPAKSGGCGISNYSQSYWTVGDNVNMAVGQGDVQVTPLQLAVAYAAMANDGTVVTPHLGAQIQSPSGHVLENIDPGPKRKLNFSASTRATIMQGLNLAAQGPSGTSDDVMGDFPMKVYGKTGTAQYGNAAQIAANVEKDYAWYACFVPASETSKPIVIVVWVEKGGFGDQSAAPVARQLLNQWFYGKPGAFAAGTNTDT